MSRFTHANLDLSRLPAPDVVKELGYEVIRAERLADLEDRCAQAEIPFNVANLESDPGVKLQEVDAYRELLDRNRINQAARAVMVAFSMGSDLEHLGALYGVRRRILADGSKEPIEEFRLRIQNAPEALPYAGLTGGGYRHRALQAAPEIKDVRVVKRRDAAGHPVMDLVLLSRTGDGTVSPTTVDAVFRAFRDDAATQLTDVVTVRAARIVPYAVTCTLRIPRGPDVSLIRAEAEKQLALTVADHHLVGRVVPTDALIAAARIKPTVKLLLAAPAGDVDPGIDGAAWCTGITLTSEVVDV